MSAQPFPPPRDWLTTPDEFGKAARPEWKTADNDRDQALLGGAIHQHRIVRQIRARLLARPGTGTRSVNELSRELGLYRDTLNSVLNGRTHASVTLLALLADSLGADLNVDLR